MFSSFKQKFQKIYNTFTNKAKTLFGYEVVDEKVLQELEKLLIESDAGVTTTRSIIKQLKQEVMDGTIKKGTDLKNALAQKLKGLLKSASTPVRGEHVEPCSIYLLVGINGSGKTTCAGKLAYQFKQQGKKVLLVAADTFRAAAQEQLTEWAEKSGASIERGKQNQDPASVVFTGMERFNKEHFDVVIIDTAGRLQTKINLMRELEKIKKIIERKAENQKICTLLTIDAMLGQNSLDQARIFNESTNLDGIILTKMDGTGKGGIVFAISQELHVPITYLSVGEQIDSFRSFDSAEYVANLLD